MVKNNLADKPHSTKCQGKLWIHLIFHNFESPYAIQYCKIKPKTTQKQNVMKTSKNKMKRCA